MMLNGKFELVIGIPTFRRPAQLRALLDSLLSELQEHPALVIVADNECGKDAPQVIEQFKLSWPSVRCIPVAARGVTQVRNTLIAQAGQEAPGWRWLIMLDDDGLATPGWLGRLLATGEQYQAHLVGGPVQGELPSGSGWLARNSVFAARGRWATGLVSTLNTTQNLAISRRVLALVPTPLFRNEYGASGGEDYDLFRRVAHAGGRFAWCDEAIIMEPAPADRLTVSALLYRYHSTGMYMAVIDRSYDGAKQVGWLAVKGLLGTCARLAFAAVTLRTNAAAHLILMTAHYLGRFAGLLGVRSSRYVAPTNPEA
ncbi:glycosyltransferase family 2 protein [Duganella levis]|uniref:Glycosyltransferase n=1 Tax=Duganella levis TaxID=2692169 RepID=A0ABW9W4Y1_9BURK|nr:glycosyltransferase [Duganella levis]MYN29092.1 glycosyltransferase [Duganella levis]